MAEKASVIIALSEGVHRICKQIGRHGILIFKPQKQILWEQFKRGFLVDSQEKSEM